MDIGFIGLGKMGFPMSRRLVEAGHRVIVYDVRPDAVAELVKLGAEAAKSAAEVADRAETVLASLPSLDIGIKVATGDDGIIRGNRVRRYVDLSTTGSRMAVQVHDVLKERGIVQIDSPVSGGVGGAEKGTLAVMVSGPLEEIELVRPALSVIGKVFVIGEKPGSAQIDEARQQLPLGHRDGGELRGDRDGRQSGPRSRRDGRGDQRRQRLQHRDDAEVSAVDPARHLQLRLRHGR